MQLNKILSVRACSVGLIISASDSEMVAAIHQWFNAQNQDHNGYENISH